MDWSVGWNRVCTYVCVYAHCYCYTYFAFVIEWFLALCFIEIWRFIVKCIECFMVMMSQKAAMGRVYINLNGCLILREMLFCHMKSQHFVSSPFPPEPWCVHVPHRQRHGDRRHHGGRPGPLHQPLLQSQLCGWSGALWEGEQDHHHHQPSHPKRRGGVFTGMFCWEYGSVVLGSCSCWHHVGVVGKEVCSLACSVGSMGVLCLGHRAVTSASAVGIM